jgi:hypothetical protein
VLLIPARRADLAQPQAAAISRGCPRAADSGEESGIRSDAGGGGSRRLSLVLLISARRAEYALGRRRWRFAVAVPVLLISAWRAEYARPQAAAICRGCPRAADFGEESGIRSAAGGGD